MTSTLVYSLRSDYCKDLVEFVKTNELLVTIVRLHDVNVKGAPPGVTRVPSLITTEGKVIIGGDIKQHLESFLMGDVEPASNFRTVDLDGTDISGNWFDLDRFGQSLQPTMTRELEEKIKISVEDAYHKLKT